ncbi:MAG: hypothetical protein ACRC49_10115, partial [Plesiomonas sp.]
TISWQNLRPVMFHLNQITPVPLVTTPYAPQTKHHSFCGIYFKRYLLQIDDDFAVADKLS